MMMIFHQVWISSRHQGIYVATTLWNIPWQRTCGWYHNQLLHPRHISHQQPIHSNSPEHFLIREFKRRPETTSHLPHQTPQKRGKPARILPRLKYQLPSGLLNKKKCTKINWQYNYLSLDPNSKDSQCTKGITPNDTASLTVSMQ